MLARMRWGALYYVLLTAIVVGSGGAIVVGCGGTTSRGLDDDPDAGVLTSSTTGTTTGSGGSIGLPDAEPDAGPDAAMDVVSDYVDPGCPDAEPPAPIIECEPLATPDGCDPGLACYPYIQRPSGDGCGFEQYGARCLEPGPVSVGSRCGGQHGWCGAGMLCVVGALPGARCLQLCDPFGPNMCPSGLICAPVDVEGYGVCG